MSILEVPEKFSHVLPNGQTFTIDNRIRQLSGLSPITAWPEGYVYIFSKGEPDKGEFMPGPELAQKEYEDAKASWLRDGWQRA